MLELVNPVVAAVRSDAEFQVASASPVSAIFMLKADVLTLGKIISAASGKEVFVHIDMAEGIGKDRKGLEFIKNCGAHGVISTKNGLITTAKELGLYTVQRLFIIDSASVNTALESVNAVKPDWAELMPGIIPRTIRSFAARTKVPIIAGGLISSKADVIAALDAGADAVSTGKAELWTI